MKKVFWFFIAALLIGIAASLNVSARTSGNTILRTNRPKNGSQAVAMIMDTIISTLTGSSSPTVHDDGSTFQNGDFTIGLEDETGPTGDGVDETTYWRFSLHLPHDDPSIKVLSAQLTLHLTQMDPSANNDDMRIEDCGCGAINVGFLGLDVPADFTTEMTDVYPPQQLLDSIRLTHGITMSYEDDAIIYFAELKVIVGNPPPVIIRPAGGELWISGEQDSIRWTGIPDGSQLRVELSLDDGVNYSAVDSNVPSDSGYYIWDIPDTLSRTCRVRIVDINDDSTYAVSERFRIKGYRLTRLRSDSSYEAFDPAVHGWGFGNSSSVLWPASWWSQFNYQTGIDSNTGQQYPQQDPFDLARPDDFPDWPLFVRAFTISQCYLSNTTSPAVYRPSALLRWRDKISEMKGSCSGFSVSSLLDFAFEQTFLDSFPLGPYVNLHDLPVNDARRKVINQFQQYFGGREHLAFSAAQSSKPPSQTIQEIKDMLRQDTADPRYLYISNTHGSGAHALVPYQIAESQIDPGVYFVDVYDCNHPGDPTYSVIIDSALGTWEYNDLGWSGGRGMYLMDPVRSYLTHPTIGSSTKRRAIPAAVTQGYLEIYNSTGASVNIINSAGDSIGFRDSLVHTTMQDAVPIIPITGGYQPPIGYYIPTNSYSVQLGDFTDSATYVSFYADSTVYSYRRFDATLNQSDLLSIETSGVGLHNPDAQTKLIDLKMIIVESSAEKAVDIIGYGINQTDSVFCGPIQHDHLRLVNIGNQKQYQIRLDNATGSGKSRFLHNGLTIPANSAEEIVPSWSDLGNRLIIYVDLGNDGTIDDSIFVDNQFTGVNDQTGKGLPTEFALHQNYPNPFNPVTTISFDLPKQSMVTLNVYNMLGQEVATLVNGVRQAGRYSISMDGLRLASGVYFYRLNAGSFLADRKMIILK